MCLGYVRICSRVKAFSVLLIRPLLACSIQLPYGSPIIIGVRPTYLDIGSCPWTALVHGNSMGWLGRKVQGIEDGDLHGEDKV